MYLNLFSCVLALRIDFLVKIVKSVSSWSSSTLKTLVLIKITKMTLLQFSCFYCQFVTEKFCLIMGSIINFRLRKLCKVEDIVQEIITVWGWYFESPLRLAGITLILLLQRVRRVQVCAVSSWPWSPSSWSSPPSPSPSSTPSKWSRSVQQYQYWISLNSPIYSMLKNIDNFIMLRIPVYC